MNFLSKYKFFFYFCNLALIFLYLFPGSLLGCFFYNNCELQPQITPDFIISTNHFFAFFALSMIGFLTFKKLNHLNFLITYLIFLSTILEFMHLIISERSFEFSDLFGNLIGVVVAIIINFFFKKFKNV
jgi:VanZ family protein